MPLHPIFPKGSRSEQDLTEKLIIESIRKFGQEFYYIPRKLVNKDDVLGEDSLSEFKNSFPIECYFDNVDNFGGNGQFMSKFGLTIEEQATVTVARRRWEDMVGRFGETILPNRPCEGDLMYFPKNDGLFEIRFVDHQNPFYQLGRLYVYKLKLELFQYSSETIESGIEAVDLSALEKSFDILTKRMVQEDDPDSAVESESDFPLIQERTAPVDRDYDRSQAIKNESKDVLDFDESNPFADFDE